MSQDHDMVMKSPLRPKALFFGSRGIGSNNT
jgi:hypothetical protein